MRLFLTGEPGVGKSTVVGAALRQLGLSAALRGFVTVAEEDTAGQRCGFRSVDVADPTRTCRLATLTSDNVRPGEGIGPYRVHLDEIAAFCEQVLTTGNSATEEPEPEPEPERPLLTVLDEVGAMQLLSPRVETLLDGAIGAQSGGRARCCFGTLPREGLHANLRLVVRRPRRSSLASAKRAGLPPS